MSQTEPPANFLAEVFDGACEIATSFTTQIQELLEQTTVSTGQTMDAIASNPILKSADNIIGLDWIMTFLGKVDKSKVETTVSQIRAKYPHETAEQIAHRLIVEKAFAGGRIGLLANIIPPIAALFLGIELIATTRLQTEMVYEIAAAYDLDLEDPARRGEVLAIFGLSLGADALKTGLSIVEIIPGIGAVVGASSNAAILYVLGQTACRFYAAKTAPTDITSMQQATDKDWQTALDQTKIMDSILAYMIKVSYPNQEWTEIMPKIREISPSSTETIATKILETQNLTALLEQLLPEFASITLQRCYDIAKSTGEITVAEQEVLSEIAIKFNLNMTKLKDNSQRFIED
jgi:uncharacterized protein (DUF697 family)